jgi:hypothetical protein
MRIGAPGTSKSIDARASTSICRPPGYPGLLSLYSCTAVFGHCPTMNTASVPLWPRRWCPKAWRSPWFGIGWRRTKNILLRLRMSPPLWLISRGKPINMAMMPTRSFSGAHLAALVGLGPVYLRAHRVSPRSLAGIVALSGIHDLNPRRDTSEQQKRAVEQAFGSDPAVLKAASPISHVRPEAPHFSS